MKKYNDVKNYWCYKEITNNGYKINLQEIKDGVRVNIVDKYGIEASFKVKAYNYDLDDIKVSGYNVYDVTQGNYDITNMLDYTNSIEECINGSLHYFYTRY